MTIQRIPFQEVPQLSSKDTAYATAKPELRPFFKYPVSIESFAQVIADKKQAEIDRELLVSVLKKQYEKLDPSPQVLEQIDRLSDPQTFTIVTAHQPSLFTGPLYYIYKIISTIHLARKLNDQYPDQHIVPVFITGGEDHDFEEMNHASIFGKEIVWENEESGSVAMMGTGSLAGALEQLKDILGSSPKAEEIGSLIEACYTRHEKYGMASVDLVNELFKSYGLIVLDMNNPELKKRFIPIMEKELFEQPSRGLIEATTQELEKVGFSQQAYPREINLFYLRDQIRERIVQEGDKFQVLNTDYTFTEAEMREELHQHPEHFSPNVVIRPLYQEYILPNLAYIGGGGEIAYWLERKTQFEHFGVNFPMLIRRNSVLWIDKGNAKKLDKLGLKVSDLFTETETLIKSYVKANAENELSLKEEKKQLHTIFNGIVEKIKEVDQTLVKTVKAEAANQMNSLQGLESRLLKAEKQRHEIELNQIRGIKDKLFPGNGLQERTDNFLNFYLRYGQDFFETLLAELDPLEEGFIVVVDE
ncbi:bacillithiol biosynthesis cysteine-adding enzyme BshC [Flavilitoribacter nigricans]|uniref:Putative cysteine ligase BshC n=1 Tax=Flavilitoribacter nigricans (strain ATCC 23147 / DSM 23189 / NBRC 102662 / NCIMB 1420 / SS-2) TaxID=1122177 RepID=A0A2D0NG71_FLAN2|nr:bacillithiol biosynthesis cysteine-adding enzyme BshC [Flavilitoribacter nigricans]PHN07485.1 bacillithiol biosynthesis cysteine-adding enzyme BshC [Flavilitoribacter nigricans DSM 23189 = NBRC 102662]